VGASSNFAGGASRPFTVNLRLTAPKPIPGPDVSFKIGKDVVTDGQQDAIAGWFQSLSPTIQDAIRTGRRMISISGYASTTGRPGSNRDLSERRAHVVERILRGHAGSAATFDFFYLGEDTARQKTPNETEDPQWRRATIVVQVPSLAAPGVPGRASGK
jgi:outer membrane protein OmpA-like peptidoglycan-associated protein